MKIGIDIDGVVADIGLALEPYLSVKKSEIKNYNLSNYGLNVRKLFNSFKETGFFSDMPPIVNAVRATKDLRRKNDLYFITARNHYKGIFEETYNWLKLNDFEFTALFCRRKSKYPTIKRHKIDLMIEDNPSEIRDLRKKGVETLVFKQPWNSQFKQRHNWRSIVTYINERNSK